MTLRFWHVFAGSLFAAAVLVWLLRPSPPSAGEGETLIVYCAAGMRQPMEEIAAAYTAQYGVKIELEYDGSGALLSKIRGAPERGHLFLAADETYLAEARKFDLLAEALPVGRQTPVLAVAPGNPRLVLSLDDLLKPGVRVVLANPDLASIGKTIKNLLTQSGDWNQLAARAQGPTAGLSFVGTVNEVAQAIKIGSADAGIVWTSTARMFDLTTVPVKRLEKARQTVMAAVLKQSAQPMASLRFARFVASRDRGAPVFSKSSVEPLSDADVWGGPAPEIPVMIGAMLKPGVEDAIQQFERREGVRITRVYNGCGVLVSQMKAGQPADMFLACDRSFLDDVRDRFGPATHLSENRLVLAVPKGNPKQITQLSDLSRGGLKIGLGHPVNSALGKITQRTLEEAKLHGKLRSDNMVIEADAGHMLVNQLRTGSLDVAIVYQSNVLSSREAADQLEIIPIPQVWAIQELAISQASPHQHLLGRLRDALSSEATRRQLAECGFGVDDEPMTSSHY